MPSPTTKKCRPKHSKFFKALSDLYDHREMAYYMIRQSTPLVQKFELDEEERLRQMDEVDSFELVPQKILVVEAENNITPISYNEDESNPFNLQANNSGLGLTVNLAN